MYENLKGEVARQKHLRHLSYEALAEMTGYATNTIAKFMSGDRETENVAAALASALEIEMSEEDKNNAPDE